jgi:hypothetical protein
LMWGCLLADKNALSLSQIEKLYNLDGGCL